jgi:hypothetical protein
MFDRQTSSLLLQTIEGATDQARQTCQPQENSVEYADEFREL